ncbi:hypothetical protein AAHC03_019039 [Spirometra sp. Aus1]
MAATELEQIPLRTRYGVAKACGGRHINASIPSHSGFDLFVSGSVSVCLVTSQYSARDERGRILVRPSNATLSRPSRSVLQK